MYIQYFSRFRRLTKKIQIGLVSVAVVAAASLLFLTQFRNQVLPKPSGIWVSVEEQPLEKFITATGPLLEASAISVIAPFDGNIIKRWVKPGDLVELDAPLLQFDTSVILDELRMAQTASIKAQEELTELMNWKASSEVSTAQRQVITSKYRLQIAEKHLIDTKTLFDKGIVANTEVESAKLELSNATEQAINSDEGLATTLRKSSTTHLQVAQLDSESKKNKVRLLEERLKHATLRAPMAGIVLKPVQKDSLTPTGVDVGSFVTSKTEMMLIGDSKQYIVRAALDEYDVVKVVPGLLVELTLTIDNSARMIGELLRVSAQAHSDQRFGISGPAPMFDIEVLVRDVPENLRSRLRLGMTTRMRVLLEKQQAALTVPLFAVSADNSGRSVVLRKMTDDPADRGKVVTIETGATLADRVVVVGGLAVGDSVWVSSAKQHLGEDSNKDLQESITPSIFNIFGRREQE